MSTTDTISESQSETGQPPTAERRVEQLLALNRAAIAITGELELDKVLQKIVDAARQLVGCKYAALGVLGDDGYIQRFPTSGISETDREKIGAPPRGHGLLGVMLRAGHSLRIPDISKDPRRVGFPPNHPKMTSLLGVPIFVQGKLVGDLYLTDKIDSDEFTEEDEWLVQLLATHASTALTNASLHTANVQALERVNKERARSQALLKVTQAINRSVDLDDVISQVVEAPMELLGAAGAAVYFLERNAARPDGDGSPLQRFVARHAVGLDESLTTEPARLPFEGSVAGRAVTAGVTQVVGDVRNETGIVVPQLRGREIRSLVVVPLSASGEMMGVLGTYSDRPSAFGEEDVLMLEAFGAVASTAIHNARLYDESQRGREAAEREQQRLRELEQMKDEFLSTAAHELRTPLTTIRMSAGLAHEQLKMLSEAGDAGKVDPRLVDLVGLVVESSQRMHSLVNDLLDLTRLEQGRATLMMENLDLREVVRASVNATAPLFESKRQRLTMHLPEAYCGVRGDAERLEQVIINLLSNAHKYSPPGSPVEVRAIRAGDEALVAVRDAGSGVPPEERERIFDRFYRSTMHRNDRTASTGLGLPIARKIAEMHKGRLWVDPAPGGGSIFTLALPVTPES